MKKTCADAKNLVILIKNKKNRSNNMMSYTILFNDRAVLRYMEAKKLRQEDVIQTIEKAVKAKTFEAINTQDTYFQRPVFNALKYAFHGLSPVVGYKNYLDDLAEDTRTKQQKSFRDKAYEWNLEEYENVQQHYRCAPR